MPRRSTERDDRRARRARLRLTVEASPEVSAALDAGADTEIPTQPPKPSKKAKKAPQTVTEADLDQTFHVEHSTSQAAPEGFTTALIVAPAPIEIVDVDHPHGDLLSGPRTTHGVARCRWCGGLFVKIFGKHWICETAACATRQIDEAFLTVEGYDPSTPYYLLPLPFQVDILQSKIPNLLVRGAAGVSKSVIARFGLYRRCQRIEGYKALLLRSTYDELYKNHLQYMETEQWGLEGLRYSGGYVRQMRHDNGSTIFSGSCETEADIEKNRGPEYDEVDFEEGSLFPVRAITLISSRARGTITARAAVEALGEEPGRVRIQSNPGGRAMLHLIEFYIKKNPNLKIYPEYDPKYYGSIGGTLDDNPYLREDYAQRVLGGLPAAVYKQLRYGDWTVFAGQFFNKFNEQIHVVDHEPAA